MYMFTDYGHGASVYMSINSMHIYTDSTGSVYISVVTGIHLHISTIQCFCTGFVTGIQDSRFKIHMYLFDHLYIYIN